MATERTVAILGAGNIGAAIGKGLVESGRFAAGSVALTRRKLHLLDDFKRQGFIVLGDNRQAVRDASIVIIAVEPQQINALLDEIRPDLNAERHLVISVVSGVSIAQILARLGQRMDVVRAMPNTAIAIGQSMTCLAANVSRGTALQDATAVFESVGTTLVLDEDQMVAATALGACGVAFFLRAIRAASQGGIEIGLHHDEALAIAAQTAKGAASLLLSMGKHPEDEIDKVTTPRGCTIAGLNQMEHEGFSSAMIKGVVTSAQKLTMLYPGGDH